MKISEIFRSFQGEGKLAGVPSVFVRTSSCNLRCVWCDTRYTSWEAEWEEREVNDVADEAIRLAKTSPAVRHIVVTGGEPTLEGVELVRLCERVARESFHVTLETNATTFVDAPIHLISASPKLRNATPPESFGPISERHQALRLNLDVLRSFLRAYNAPPDRDCQVKFVVEREDDLAEIEHLERETPIPKDKIMLMPQSIYPADLAEKSVWLENLAARRGYGFSPRLHIARYGNRRGV